MWYYIIIQEDVCIQPKPFHIVVAQENICVLQMYIHTLVLTKSDHTYTHYTILYKHIVTVRARCYGRIGQVCVFVICKCIF